MQHNEASRRGLTILGNARQNALSSSGDAEGEGKGSMSGKFLALETHQYPNLKPPRATPMINEKFIISWVVESGVRGLDRA
jgi:hypothetical protein